MRMNLNAFNFFLSVKFMKIYSHPIKIWFNVK